jgi:hypothetical protein
LCDQFNDPGGMDISRRSTKRVHPPPAIRAPVAGRPLWKDPRANCPNWVPQRVRAKSPIELANTSYQQIGWHRKGKRCKYGEPIEVNTMRQNIIGGTETHWDEDVRAA